MYILKYSYLQFDSRMYWIFISAALYSIYLRPLSVAVSLNLNSSRVVLIYFLALSKVRIHLKGFYKTQTKFIMGPGLMMSEP